MNSLSRQADTASSVLLARESASQIKAIREAILSAAGAVRRRHPWLNEHQNSLGLSVFVIGTAGTAFDAWAYAEGWMPWWFCVPLTMFWLSLLHELEHDLIHRIFFRDRPWVLNFMLAMVWVLRPNTINPWIRRPIHLHHHKMSGTESDLEEIALGNGEPMGMKRMLMMLDLILGYALRPVKMVRLLKEYSRAASSSEYGAKRLERAAKLSFFPIGNVFYLFWHGLILFSIAVPVAGALGYVVHLSRGQQQWLVMLHFGSVVLFLPNVIRSFCLYFVTSNIHYYGDVVPGDLVRQTQVWTSLWVAPMNLFCFNFGGTHAIHHFVVREPFYLRQVIASRVYPVMRCNGVRFNDFATLRRANRWH